MVRPTAADIRSWSQVPFDQLGFPVATPDLLDRLVTVAVDLIVQFTGRPFDDTMPSGLESLAELASQRATEVLAYQSSTDSIETAADFMSLSSFSAGSYSESRRSLQEVRDTKMLVPDPAMDTVLWALMTDDKRDEWLAFLHGQPIPSFIVEEVDWRGGGVFVRPEAIQAPWDGWRW